LRRLGCLLVLGVAGALVQAHTVSASHTMGGASTPTATSVAVPTVSVPPGNGASVPTVVIPPKPTATPTHVKKPATHKKPSHHKKQKQHQPSKPSGTWIEAFLTSYCPGSAGWISSSGMTVFYGMLANDYYQFGTKVYLPVLGITGVVEDRMGFVGWDYFDVWSPVCYSTPTGWYKVEVLS